MGAFERLRREGALVLTAAQFLTRLPTPAVAFQPEALARSARYFPLVGQLVGGGAALVLLAAGLVWSPAVAALLAVAAGILLTGALHEDGLADAADGLFGGASPSRRVEIMRDSRIGTYGVLALVLTLGLKVAALASLAPVQAAWGLLAAHGGGRAAAVMVMARAPYAPAAGSGKWTPAAVGGGSAAVAALIALWPLLGLPLWAAAASAVLAAAGGAALARLSVRRLGGYTGAVLGAVEQAFEAVFLLALAALTG